MEMDIQLVMALIGLALIAITPIIALIASISIEETVIYEKDVDLSSNKPISLPLLFNETAMLSLRDPLLIIKNKGDTDVVVNLHGCNEITEKSLLRPHQALEIKIYMPSCYIYSEEPVSLRVIIKGSMVKYPYRSLVILALALPVAGSALLINYIIYKSIYRQ
ncbi:MAG: hypothetical protein QXS23_00465 [Desulfurococcaceae archaeon]